MEQQEVFLTSRQVRERYGNCSQMWLHRRKQDDLRWPSPLIIAGRRFWRLSALVAYEQAISEIATYNEARTSPANPKTKNNNK